MKSLLYIALVALAFGAFSCSKSESSQKDTHKLSDEVILDSISIDEFKSMMEKAISDNDTADIQKLLGLAQNTYQKISVRNDAEAENFAQQVKDVILNEPYLDNLISNKANFFFKFNNVAFDTPEEQSKDEEESNMEQTSPTEDATVVGDEEITDVSNTGASAQKEIEKKAAEPKKNDEKKNSTDANASQALKDRVKSSFEKSAQSKANP